MAFKHRKKPEELEAFIEGAEDQPKASKKETDKKENLIPADDTQILLTVTGRLDRQNGCTRPFLFHPLAELDEEIQRLCRGSKPLVYNYLVRLGLEQLKQEGKLRIASIDKNHIVE